MLSLPNLAAWLGWPVDELRPLLIEGLPREDDDTFDPTKVADWLESRGLASREFTAPLVDTLAKVARAFGVRRDTVAKEWAPRGMPGAPGAYDLNAIAHWKLERLRDPLREARKRSDAPAASGRQELELERLTLDNERRRLRLELDTKKLIPAELPLRIVEQTLAVIATQLEQLGERLPGLLGSTDPEVIAQARAELDRELDNVRHAAADCLEQLGGLGPQE